LERKLDVVDFGTPVQTVSTFGHGNNARMVIEPKGLWSTPHIKPTANSFSTSNRLSKIPANWCKEQRRLQR